MWNWLVRHWRSLFRHYHPEAHHETYYPSNLHARRR